MPSASNAGVFTPESYLGTVHWYRKDFRLPRASRSSKWVLRFESVNYRARVWLNGKPLGTHVGSYLPFELRAKSVRRRGVNRLVVRVDSRRQKFDIPPLSQRASGAFEGGWWNYNGILREVYLRKVDQFDFAEVFFEPRLRCRTCAATVIVHAKVANVNSGGATAARHRARSAGARCGSAATACRAAATARFRARLRIRNPRLWSPERPALYKGNLQVRTSSGRRVQRYRVTDRHPLAGHQPPGPDPAERTGREPARREHARGLPQPRGGADAGPDAPEHRLPARAGRHDHPDRTTRSTPTRSSSRTATGS